MWENDKELATTSDVRIETTASERGTFPRPDDDTPLGAMMGYAQALVRDPAKLIARARQVGGLLAKKGFYQFGFGGKQVSGASVVLAQALAQEWGGVTTQVKILRTEHLSGGGRRIHFRATTTDMKMLVAAQIEAEATTVAPPGRFAEDPEQSERWHSMQTQKASSTIVRNAILDILPAWYVDAGKNAAIAAEEEQATGGKPLPEARIGALTALGAIGITQAEAEAYVGEPLDLWAAPQLSLLRDLYGNISKARMSVEQFRARAKPSTTSEPAAVSVGNKASLGIKPKPAPTPATPVVVAPEPPAATPAALQAPAAPHKTSPAVVAALLQKVQRAASNREANQIAGEAKVLCLDDESSQAFSAALKAKQSELREGAASAKKRPAETPQAPAVPVAPAATTGDAPVADWDFSGKNHYAIRTMVDAYRGKPTYDDLKAQAWNYLVQEEGWGEKDAEDFLSTPAPPQASPAT